MEQPKTNETVDIIASGYEWTCPDCEELNKEICYTKIVTCKCGKSYYTDDPDHAKE
jgi:uncharacterized protein (DUF983 family)